MNPHDSAFLSWAARYGYVPWRFDEPHQRETFARHWLAWQAGLPPASSRACAALRASGLLEVFVNKG